MNQSESSSVSGNAVGAVLLRAFMLFVVASLALETAYATNIVQPFQMHDGRKIRGVIVRQTSKGYVLALPNGVAELSRRDVMIPGTITREAAKINELLTLMEKAVNTGDFERVNKMLQPLSEAIDAFRTMTKPFVDSIVATADQRRECLLQALEYYRGKEEGFPQTIRSLQLIGDVDRYQAQRQNGRLLVAASTLADLFRMKAEIAALNPVTSRVTRDKDHAASVLDDLTQAIIDDLRAAALTELKSRQKTEQCLALMSALKGGSAAGIDSHLQADGLLTDVLEINATIRSELSEAINALFSLDDKSEADLRRHTAAVIDLRAYTDFLIELKARLFGPDKEKWTDTVDESIRLNEEKLEKSSQRKGLVSDIRADIRQALLYYEKEKFREAYDTYRALQAHVRDVASVTPEIRTTIAEGVTRSNAMLLIDQLRRPGDQSSDDLRQLLEDAESFMEKHEEELGALDIDGAVIEREKSKVKNYLKFMLRFKNLQRQAEVKPVVTWERMIMMSRWMDGLLGAIPDSALADWNHYLESSSDDLFELASTAFFRDPPALDEDAWKLYISFVTFKLKRRHYSDARKLVEQGLAFDELEANAEWRNETLILYAEIADGLVSRGDMAGAAEIYTTLESQFPDFAAAFLVKDKAGEQMLKNANRKIDEGDRDGAIAVYKDLAGQYPEFAENRRIYDRIVELTFVRNVPLDRDAELREIDDLCSAYAGHLENVRILRDIADRIVEEFEASWLDGNYVEAVEEYIEFGQSFPNFSREADIMQKTARKIKGKVYLVLQEHRNSGKPTSISLVSALKSLIQRHPVVSSENKLDLLYVDVKLALATEFIKTGQFVRAFEIYEEIINTNPDIARDKELGKKMGELQWRYNVDRWLSPLGITDRKDSIAFALTILMWPLLFLRSFMAGRAKGHMGYRMLHVASVLAVFLVLLSCFIYGKYPYFQAFVFAFVLPQIIFQSLGYTTYLCFPLIYCERILGFEYKILLLLQKLPKDKVGFLRPIIRLIAKDVDRRREDLPLLHDRTLYKIEKAIYVSQAKPEKGYELFEKLMKRLEQELVKTSSWKKNYSTCLYNLGAIAYHLDRHDTAKQHLLEHLDLSPQHVETRSLLSELLFEEQDYNGAIPHLKVCLAAYGGDDAMWYRLGRCFFEVGSYVAAYKCFGSVDEKDRDVLFYGARSYAKADELAIAVEWFQALLRYFPQDSEAIYSLAAAFAQSMQDKKAVKIIGLLKKDDPYYARAQVLVGNILLRSGKLKEANEIFSHALKSDNDCVQALIGLGQMAMIQEKQDQATSIFEQALKVAADNPTANYFYAILTESTDEIRAIEHYKKAAALKERRRVSEKRIGIIYFRRKDYELATGHLESAVAEGEDAPWILFACAYGLAVHRKHDSCRNVLGKILASPSEDASWRTRSPNAVYSLGIALFEGGAFGDAYQCFEYVRDHLGKESDAVKELLIETRFRMVIQLLSAGSFVEAHNTLAELAEGITDPDRFATCKYYSALCLLYLRKYTDAAKILKVLADHDKKDPRYQYHHIVAELGCGNVKQGAQLLLAMRKRDDLTLFLRAGLQTVQAYLEAKQGHPKKAALTLQVIPDYREGEPGDEYIRRELLLSRLFYLCHARDSRQINSLINDLPDDRKASAALLHATAAVESGQLKVAKDIIKPFADHSEQSNKLFTILASEVAKKAVKDKAYGTARSIFEEIPAPSKEIENVCVLLTMSESMESIDEYEAVNNTIMHLSNYLPKLDDGKLAHILVHNLGILHLKRALMVEEAVGFPKINEIWHSCLGFWEENIFKSQDFWNHEQARFSSDGQTLKPFSKREAEGICKKFLDDNFAEISIAYIIGWLDRNHAPGVERHLALLDKVSTMADSAMPNYEKLKSGFSALMKGIDRSDDRFLTWDFNVLHLSVKQAISNALELDDADELQHRIETFEICRDRYESPKDYRLAQRQYNSNLLDALHLGINDKFSEAGNKLNLVLADIPPGMVTDEMVERLTEIREACRTTGGDGAKESKLKEDFEKLYTTVKSKRMASETKVATTNW